MPYFQAQSLIPIAQNPLSAGSASFLIYANHFRVSC